MPRMPGALVDGRAPACLTMQVGKIYPQDRSQCNKTYSGLIGNGMICAGMVNQMGASTRLPGVHDRSEARTATA